ncbi:hypothetical protein REPUB_Repub13aG0185500 [Reevesia pubescens]
MGIQTMGSQSNGQKSHLQPSPLEARISAMRCAILETFPEPNRHLLQRILKMMHTISSYSHENRMTPSAVAACMAPLLLPPLLAGECELEDDFDVNGDNSAQLLATANAANNTQAIITTLLEEYDNIFDSPVAVVSFTDSRIENSASEDLTDDENPDMKDNGYYDAENEADPDTDEDPERVLSGKLSENSGSASSDLYDYNAANTFSNLTHIIRRHGPWASAWVGESGGAYNSGGAHVSDTFVSSFWYLDQLGMASKYHTKVYCRQTLIGGNYGLLNATTYVPNPDYYSALLWHRLMGKVVLAVASDASPFLRSYAHCSK